MNDEELEERLEDLEARFEAMNRARISIFDRLEELEEQMETLLQTVEVDPQRTSYEEMTRGQKVHKIRTTLLEQAVETNGKAAMKYKEVKALFDGHPSTGHCYDLMKYAAELEGYNYETDPNKRVTVKSDAVNDKSLVHIVNNENRASRGNRG